MKKYKKRLNIFCARESRTVLNIRAGTGSYEPEDKYVTAVEPSSVSLLSSME